MTYFRTRRALCATLCLVAFSQTGWAQNKEHAPAPLTPRIIGGVQTDPGEYPWMVSLQFTEEPEGTDAHFCGGTLIAPEWILTAAHCVEGGSPSDIRPVIGAHKLKAGGTVGTVESIFVHEDFDYWTLASDIALIKLSAPVDVVPLSNLVTPSSLALTIPGTMATAVGWGLTRLDAEFVPNTLREVDVPIVDEAICSSTIEAWDDEIEFLDSMMCAGYAEGGKDPCYGDSGGPLLVPDGDGFALSGIVSFGNGCALPNEPGFFTRVSSFSGEDGWLSSCMAGECEGTGPGSDFVCDGDYEIPEDWECDGYPDCEDGTDEHDECPEGCHVPDFQLCDGIPQCEDGSDEDEETCELECDIPEDWFCDGISDCPGDIDESEELCGEIECDIPEDWFCDGEDDCLGGVDEDDCGNEGGAGGGGGGPGTDPEPSGELLITLTPLSAGSDCEHGGVSIQTGHDLNEDESLNDSEVEQTQHVCNGAPGPDGEDGLTSLVVVSEVMAGSACETGGQRVNTGLDTNENGELDKDEIQQTATICHATDGLSTLVRTEDEAKGANCENGGQKLELGLDKNDDAVLSSDEVQQTSYVCHGEKGKDSKNSDKGGCSVSRGPGSPAAPFLWLTSLVGLSLWHRRRRSSRVAA